MKKILVLFVVSVVAFCAAAQVDLVKKLVDGGVSKATAEVAVKTKFQKYSSRKGGFIRYEEISVPEIKASDALFSSAKVRRYIDFHTDAKRSFLILSIGKDKNTEYIDIEDLRKVVDAIKTLKERCIADSIAQHNLKCFYVTEDGFKVGYNIKKDKVTWFFSSGGEEYKFAKDFDFEARMKEILDKVDEYCGKEQ